MIQVFPLLSSIYWSITMGNYCIASIPTPDGIINNRDREYSMQAYESFQSWVREYTIYDWVNFYSQIQTCNLDTGWVLCHISVVFFRIPFKPQKAHNSGYSIYMPSFFQFLPLVYPAGRHDRSSIFFLC